MNLSVFPEAKKELEESKEYYELKKENLGKEFAAEVDNTFSRMLENPEQFPVVYKKVIRKALVNRFPFVILFFVKGMFVVVISVFHTHKNPKGWKKRHK